MSYEIQNAKDTEPGTSWGPEAPCTARPRLAAGAPPCSGPAPSHPDCTSSAKPWGMASRRHPLVLTLTPIQCGFCCVDRTTPGSPSALRPLSRLPGFTCTSRFQVSPQTSQTTRKTGGDRKSNKQRAGGE